MAFAGIREARDRARELNKASYDPDYYFEAGRNHIGENYVAKVERKTGRHVERIYA